MCSHANSWACAWINSSCSSTAAHQAATCQTIWHLPRKVHLHGWAVPRTAPHTCRPLKLSRCTSQALRSLKLSRCTSQALRSRDTRPLSPLSVHPGLSIVCTWNGKTAKRNCQTVKWNDAENGTECENGETVNSIGNFFLTRTVCIGPSHALGFP